MALPWQWGLLLWSFSLLGWPAMLIKRSGLKNCSGRSGLLPMSELGLQQNLSFASYDENHMPKFSIAPSVFLFFLLFYFSIML